jgi:hypothetical protein
VLVLGKRCAHRKAIRAWDLTGRQYSIALGGWVRGVTGSRKVMT